MTGGHAGHHIELGKLGRSSFRCYVGAVARVEWFVSGESRMDFSASKKGTAVWYSP